MDTTWTLPEVRLKHLTLRPNSTPLPTGEQAEGNWVLRWFDSRVQPLFWCRLRNGAKTVRDSDLCLNSFWKKGTCAVSNELSLACTSWPTSPAPSLQDSEKTAEVHGETRCSYIVSSES